MMLLGICATLFLPLGLLLAAAFFIIFACQKTDKGWIKFFGNITAIILVICAVANLVGGIMMMTSRQPGMPGGMPMGRQGGGQQMMIRDEKGQQVALPPEVQQAIQKKIAEQAKK